MSKNTTTTSTPSTPIKTIIDGLPKEFLSVSQINSYRQCGYRYFYRYILGLKTVAGVALVFGSAGHKALEENARHKSATYDDLSAAQMIKIFNSYFDSHIKRDVGLQAAECRTLKRSAAGLLTVFRQEVAGKMLANRNGIEREIQMTVAGIPMLGYIDFDGDMDGTCSVIDYKFVGRKKSQKDADQDIQLSFYSMATEISSVGFISLVKPHPRYHPEPEVEITMSTRTENDYKTFENIVRRTARDIVAQKFKPVSPAGRYLCNAKYCDFWNICPGGGCQHPTMPRPGTELKAALSLPEEPEPKDVLDQLFPCSKS